MLCLVTPTLRRNRSTRHCKCLLPNSNPVLLANSLIDAQVERSHSERQGSNPRNFRAPRSRLAKETFDGDTCVRYCRGRLSALVRADPCLPFSFLVSIWKWPLEEFCILIINVRCTLLTQLDEHANQCTLDIRRSRQADRSKLGQSAGSPSCRAPNEV